MKLSPQKFGQELRGSGAHFVACRRLAAALTLAGMGSLAVVALYQLGLLRKTP